MDPLRRRGTLWASARQAPFVVIHVVFSFLAWRTWKLSAESTSLDLTRIFAWEMRFQESEVSSRRNYEVSAHQRQRTCTQQNQRHAASYSVGFPAHRIEALGTMPLALAAGMNSLETKPFRKAARILRQVPKPV